MERYSFRLVLDRPMTQADEDTFDHSPHFTDGKVSLLMSEAGQPTVLECDDVLAVSKNAAMTDVIRRIGLINNLRVTECLPAEEI
jgi:hypothetical protein